MKLKNLIIAISIGLGINASAAVYAPTNVINGDGSTDALITNSDGLLNSGGIMVMGYFPDSFVIGPISSLIDMTNTIGSFTPLASGSIGGLAPSLGAGAFPGYYEGANVQGAIITAGLPPAIPNPLLGRMIYLFAGNMATLEGSDEWAIKALLPFADDSPLEQTYVGNPFGGAAPDFGSVGEFTGNASGFGTSTHQTLQLAPIPEPSAALLGALGALGLLRRRRI